MPAEYGAKQSGNEALALATSISDGARVDWRKAASAARGQEELAVIRGLEVLAKIADVHRSRRELESAPGEAPPDGTRTLVATEENGVDLVRERSPVAAGADATLRWGHLRLLEKIGEGSFGEVFRTWDTRLDREVALKLLRRQALAASGELASSVIREGRLLARVRHPNILTVYGADEIDGRVGVWMEFVRGRTLGGILEDQGPLGAREAALIGQDVCRAAAAVHNAGLVHRDIKAANVMREEGGRILLMDFGAGRDVRPSRGDAGSECAGTPLYMAPEVLRGEPATVRSDLYSVGVLLYHLVTKSYPVEGSRLHELAEIHARGGARSLRDARPDIPDAFARVVEHALAEDPAARFASAGQMERALSDALGVTAAEGAARAIAAGAPDPSTTVRSRGVRGRLPLFAGLAGGIAVAVTWLVATRGGRLGAAYTVEAAFYRDGPRGIERVLPGGRVAPGDKLFLEIEGSSDLHVYVVNEDERGAAFLLFPLPGYDLQNPLRARTRHVLPGFRDGEMKRWQVTSAGGREHFLIVTSPRPLADFEAEMTALARPRADREMPAALLLSDGARARLRGVGGIASPSPTQPAAPATRLFEMARSLDGRTETARGVWVRQIDLENPAP
jgi:hypothetical protein